MLIHEYITFKEAILILRDTNVHPLLQSAYLDFVISAFVDLNVEESGVDIDNIQHCYVSYDLLYDALKLHYLSLSPSTMPVCVCITPAKNSYKIAVQLSATVLFYI